MAVSFYDALIQSAPPRERLCIDGTISLADIAKAGRTSMRTAKRAVQEFVDRDKSSTDTGDGAVLAFDREMLPAPETKTRAELAAIVARQIGLGIYRPRENRQPPPQPKPKREKSVATNAHPYRAGVGGRSIKAQPDGRQLATLTCRCSRTHDVSFVQLAGAQQMDQKFKQAGWRLDPAKCPGCIHKPKGRDDTMAVPSRSAIQAQAKMFNLLGQHFDGDAGVYSSGWSDDQIAKECSLAAETVKAFRDEAFGPLKVPDEVAQLERDIDALGQLFAEAVAPFQTELDKLRSRQAELRRKFSA